jgi:hypothetical protein
VIHFLRSLFGIREKPEPKPEPKGLAFDGPAIYRIVETKLEGGYGLVVERIEDGKRLRWDLLHRNDSRLYAFNVAGESFYPDAVASDAFAPGCQVELKYEPNNPYDRNAIGVLSADGAIKGGHVPKDECLEVLPLIARPHAAMVMWATDNEEGRRVAIRILIIEQGCPITD